MSELKEIVEVPKFFAVGMSIGDGYQKSPFYPAVIQREVDSSKPSKPIILSPMTLFRIQDPMDKWVLEHYFGMDVLVEVFNYGEYVYTHTGPDKLKVPTDLERYRKCTFNDTDDMVTTVTFECAVSGFARVTGLGKLV